MDVSEGSVFGKWTVLYRAPNKRGSVTWACVCECGKKNDIAGSILKNGRSKGCLSCRAKERKKRKCLDYTGMTFGSWLVIREVEKKPKSQSRRWECRCKCGKITTVIQGSLTTGKSTMCRSCGMKGKNIKDLTGSRFGSLTVLDFSHQNKDGRSYYLCKCDCGKNKTTSLGCLTGGSTESCGCKRNDPESAFNRALSSYRKRKWPFELSDSYARKLFESNCYYCGAPPMNTCRSMSTSYRYSGIDRVDSSIGYVESNCVPCCIICNRAKNNMKIGQFFEWVNRLVTHLNKTIQQS